MRIIPCEGGFWLVAEGSVEERQLEELKGGTFKGEDKFATRRVTKKNSSPPLALFLRKVT